jgi:hypothetical protein
VSHNGNMVRDMFWCKPGLSTVSFATVSGRLNSDGIVNQDKGMMVINGTPTVNAARAAIMMDQPEDHNTPYRVQLYTNSTAYRFVIGYATTQTGTNDTVANEILLPIPDTMHIDEIFAVEGANQPYPIYFGLRSITASSSVTAILSVQKLNEVHPQSSSLPKQ